MKCFACAAVLPDDALFCSACGTELARQASAPEAQDLEVALAAANLLRVRRRYEDAEKRCIEVLRADPNNVHAHSLLGDIYRDQGRLDDAREWYRMVLDLDPHSRADREKLAEVERLRALRDRSTAPGIGTAHETSSSVVRWLAVVLAVCLLGALTAVLTYRYRVRPVRGTAGVVAEGRLQTEATMPARVDSGTTAPARRSPLPGEIITDAPREAASQPEEDETLLEREAHLEQVLSARNPWQSQAVGAAVVLTLDGRSALLLLHGVLSGGAPSPDATAVATLQCVRSIYEGDPEVEAVDVVFRAASEGVAYHTLLRARALRHTVAAYGGARTGAEARKAFVLWRWTPAWPGASAADGTTDE